MTDSPSAVRRLTSAEVSSHAHDLVELQRAAYSVEAELIGDHRIPQLTETRAELVAAELVWHIAEADGRIVGAVAHSDASHAIDIDRLVVHPGWHRRGLGRMLVCALPHAPTTVSTGRDNQPARALYEFLGFRHIGDREVVPGLWVSTYDRW